MSRPTLLSADEIRHIAAIDGPSLLAQVKANQAKRQACPRHAFVPKEGRFAKYACTACGADADVSYVSGYIDALRSMGVDPNSVLPPHPHVKP